MVHCSIDRILTIQSRDSRVGRASTLFLGVIVFALISGCGESDDDTEATASSIQSQPATLDADPASGHDPSSDPSSGSLTSDPAPDPVPEPDPDPVPPSGQNSAQIRRGFAQASVEVHDSFDNGSLAASDTRSNYWTSFGNATESAGRLSLAGPGMAGLRSNLSWEHNFFLQPLRIDIRGVQFQGTQSEREESSLELTLSSTVAGRTSTPDAFIVELFGNGRLTVRTKIDSPNTPAATIILDEQLAVDASGLRLVIDQESYLIELTGSSEPIHFDGLHGLTWSQWGDFGSSAVQLTRRESSSNSASATVDEFELKALKLFDTFRNGTVQSIGYRSAYWKPKGGGQTTAVESNGQLSLDDTSGSKLSSPVSGQLNFFAEEMLFRGSFGLDVAGSDEVDTLRLALTSEQNTGQDASAALSLSIDTSRRLQLGWKTGAPGQSPLLNPAVDTVLPFAPTMFELGLSRDGYTLTVAGSGDSRTFAGPHDMKWHQWSATGDASLFLEATSSQGSAAGTVGRWNFLMAERSAGYFMAPTVLGPFPDSVSLELPELELTDQNLIKWGLLDVTKPPFYADNSGALDTTEPLRAALRYARENYLVAYFPPGDYLVSGTLACAQAVMLRSSNALFTNREGPCYLLGSRTGDRRPRIILASASPGFADVNARRPVIDIWARRYDGDPEESMPNRSYNQMVVNLDIEIGENNPGAVGIALQGAQGSGIQESRIVATHGFAGIEGASGSGGSHADIEVIGGEYGLYLAESQPAPTIVGISLRDQTRSAIYYSGRQTLSAVGVHITVPSFSAGPAIAVGGRSAPRGQLALVDSVVDFSSASSANLAISTASSIYLRNVYVRAAGTIVKTEDNGTLAGNVNGWRRIDEYARGVTPPPYNSSIGTFQYEAPIYTNGVRGSNELLTSVDDNVAPPADLRTRHLWAADFPGFEHPAAVNVREAPYYAAGDGITDDTAALQQAIDENEIVFLPKGFYRLSATLDLKPNTKLIGIGRTLTNLLASPSSSQFSNPANPQPLIRTSNNASAETTLAFLQLRPQVDAPGVYALHWRAGAQSVYRAVNLSRLSEYGYGSAPGKNKNPTPSEFPLVYVSGNGGGKWYNFYQMESNDMGPGYRHILIEGTSEDLNFYQFNPEHAQGEANAEISNASHVSLFGVKGESNYPVLWIRDSDDVALYGYGGNAAALESHETYDGGFAPYTPSLFRVERSLDLRLVNLVDTPRVSGDNQVFGEGKDPSNWYMVVDIDSTGNQFQTVPLDRPVLYRRTTR